MNKIMHVVAAAGISIVLGCVSMPDPVNTAYLAEIKSDESARIQELEKAILAKKGERDAAEKAYSVALAEETVARETADYLEEKSEVLRAVEKLHSLRNDEAALGRNRQSADALRKTRADHDGYVKYAAAASASLKAALEVTEAEMSVAVWEMNYEKSKVARGYQDRRPEEYEQKKSGLARYFQGKSKIDPGEYEKYLVKQRDIVNEKQKKHRKALEEQKSLERFRDLKHTVE